MILNVANGDVATFSIAASYAAILDFFVSTFYVDLINATVEGWAFGIVAGFAVAEFSVGFLITPAIRNFIFGNLCTVRITGINIHLDMAGAGMEHYHHAAVAIKRRRGISIVWWYSFST